MAASASVFRFEPNDQYNQTLAANVLLSDRANPAPERRCTTWLWSAEALPGWSLLRATAGLGASVALVEKTLMGGDCLHFCRVPSKALILCCTRRGGDARC